MIKISAADFLEMSPAELRLAETNHLFHLFKESRNAEVNYGMFLLTTYFDALLFCFVSIEEMVDTTRKEQLRSLDSFMFFKALRNIATHHSVLSGIKGKFERPISRIVSVSVGGTVPFSEQLFLVPEKLEAIFSSILLERPSERRTIDVARRHLAALKEAGGDIMLVDVIEAAVAEATPHVA
jgi:hypothetical protein